MNAAFLRTAAAVLLTASATAGAVLLTIIAGAGAALAGQAEAGQDGGAVLAEVRVTQETPGAEAYRGVPYLWLGRATIHLRIDVPPAPGHVLELDWGAKNDAREATALVNGRAVAVRGGGYDGFRPLRVEVPPGVTGARYEVGLAAAGGKAGFLAGVRLLAADKSAAAPAGDSAPPRPITLTTSPPSALEAFPEMRALWDRQPSAPASAVAEPREEAAFRQAEKNARLAAEGLYRCRRFVDGWLAHADPKTGLIPRNLDRDKDLWNAKDAAADNYPFMVLTAALTDQGLFNGRMREMLRTETRITSRIDRLPDDFRFSTQGFASERPDLDAVIFGGAEYVKDGLIPLTEWLGPSPWSERMLGILDDAWSHASVETPFGRIPTRNVEVNGDLLQACSRAFWLTGDRKYLDWAVRLGDYYLLGDQHPTRHSKTLRLIDHGCEVVNGLSELYAAVSFADLDKKKAYERPIHEMLDRILEIGRNEHGQLYASIEPQTGAHADGLCDTWGYDYDAVYTVFLIDGTAGYREAVRHVLSDLKAHYTGHNWGGADGYADSLEGAINLYNREAIDSAAEWIDSEIRAMWAIQKPDGVIEGWHGDGNFARTTLMYGLWKTQGLTAQPWRPDVRVGAVRDGSGLRVSLAADQPWQGRLRFDVPRHKVHMKLPIDYTRINQFPEWFTVEDGKSYTVRDMAKASPTVCDGRQMAEGLAVTLEPGEEVRLTVRPTE